LNQPTINIQNKKARYEYEILENYTAGMVLTGTEIKSIRKGLASIKESFCEFNEKGELFVINMYIKEFVNASYFNHDPRNSRKLLLNKRELKKLERKVKDVGLTIIPLRLFLSEKGLAKLDIALARGKREHDKRHSIRDRDNKRDLARIRKDFKKN
jgi:SsrA-binding protein